MNPSSFPSPLSSKFRQLSIQCSPHQNPLPPPPLHPSSSHLMSINSRRTSSDLKSVSTSSNFVSSNSHHSQQSSFIVVDGADSTLTSTSNNNSTDHFATDDSISSSTKTTTTASSSSSSTNIPCNSAAVAIFASAINQMHRSSHNSIPFEQKPSHSSSSSAKRASKGNNVWLFRIRASNSRDRSGIKRRPAVICKRRSRKRWGSSSSSLQSSSLSTSSASSSSSSHLEGKRRHLLSVTIGGNKFGSIKNNNDINDINITHNNNNNNNNNNNYVSNNTTNDYSFNSYNRNSINISYSSWNKILPSLQKQQQQQQKRQQKRQQLLKGIDVSTVIDDNHTSSSRQSLGELSVARETNQSNAMALDRIQGHCKSGDYNLNNTCNISRFQNMNNTNNNFACCSSNKISGFHVDNHVNELNCRISSSERKTVMDSKVFDNGF